MLDNLLVWFRECYDCGGDGWIFEDDNNYEHMTCERCDGYGIVGVIVD